MKSSKLKPLIKSILKEIYKINESSGTIDSYEISFDSLIIPGLSTRGDSITVSISLDYDVQDGAEEQGMFGSPEHSSPAESDMVNILDWNFGVLTITNQSGQSREKGDLQTISKQQFEILKKSINNYIESNEDEIKEYILNKNQ